MATNYGGLAASLAARPTMAKEIPIKRQKNPGMDMAKDAYIQQPRGGGGFSLSGLQPTPGPIGSSILKDQIGGGFQGTGWGTRPPYGGGYAPAPQQQPMQVPGGWGGMLGPPIPGGGPSFGGFAGSRPDFGGNVAQLPPMPPMQVPGFGPPQKPMAGPSPGGGPVQTPLEDFNWAGARPGRRFP